MGKKKLVIDTNIFVSAFGWGGKPRLLIEKVVSNEYEVYTSLNQFSEIKKVLDYPKLDFTEEQKLRIIMIINEITRIVNTKGIPRISDDPKDDMILGIADVVAIDYIITGDDDLLRLKEYKGTKIVKISDFLKDC